MRICTNILCQKPIVQDAGEPMWNFRKRKSCNRACADASMRRKLRLRAEAEQEKEKQRVEKRRLAMKRLHRSGLERIGCVFTDCLD